MLSARAFNPMILSLLEPTNYCHWRDSQILVVEVDDPREVADEVAAVEGEAADAEVAEEVEVPAVVVVVSVAVAAEEVVADRLAEDHQEDEEEAGVGFEKANAQSLGGSGFLSVWTLTVVVVVEWSLAIISIF